MSMCVTETSITVQDVNGIREPRFETNMSGTSIIPMTTFSIRYQTINYIKFFIRSLSRDAKLMLITIAR